MGILLDLADELLRIILEHVSSEAEALISLDNRGYLSQESFRLHPAPDHDHAQAIGRESVQDLLPTLQDSLGPLNIRHFVQKVNFQKDIVKTREDARVLNLAISAFTALQHVQILRVQSEEDALLISCIRSHAELNHLVELKWPPACLHSTKTIAAALVESRSPCSRFSSPMLSPQSVLGAVSNPPTTLSLLAERITCLELHFDDPMDLDVRMQELSSLSKAFFTKARNLEAVHIGFPSYRPLTLRLSDIFGDNIKWEKLQAFGIQAWRLDADEIIGLALRHSATLRGFRLRDVLLKDGSHWKDVLVNLKDNMKLDWVSLRRIDYEKHFDESRVLGAEIPDESLIDSDSSSDENDDWDDDDAYNYYVNNDLADGSNDSVPDSDVESNAGTEDEPEQGGHLAFPQTYPDTPVSVPCCNSHLDSVDALGDDGLYVTNAQRKFWERWCVNKCSHGHK